MRRCFQKRHIVNRTPLVNPKRKSLANTDSLALGFALQYCQTNTLNNVYCLKNWEHLCLSIEYFKKMSAIARVNRFDCNCISVFFLQHRPQTTRSNDRWLQEVIISSLSLLLAPFFMSA